MWKKFLEHPDSQLGRRVRRDLLAEHAGELKLVQLAWVERQVDVDWGNPPDWLNDARPEHAASGCRLR